MFALSTPLQAGSDFRDPDRGFHIWGTEQLVTTPGEPNKYWPNVGDLVFDKANGFRYINYVDQTTGMWTSETVYLPTKPSPEDGDGMLVAVGPGYPSESFRLLYDNSVTPAVIVPSDRLHAYSSQSDYYMVFLGSDVDEKTGKIISLFFDPSGTLIGPQIPLETDELNSRIVKTHFPGNTTEKLKDNDLVTIVHYSAVNGEVSRATLLVQTTEAIRQIDTSKRYIKSLELESPYISQSEPRVIQFPLNVPVKSVPMTVVVTYRDGKKSRMSIDNTTVFLHGLKNYIATEVGQEFDLDLALELAPDEISYMLVPTTNRRIVVPYKARTAPNDAAYETRLFVYPSWVNETVGYRLEFWLYNLDRQVYYNVTPKVELGADSRPFNPTGYGILQTLTYALNLNAVDGRFLPTRNVFKFQVALLNAGSNRSANWEVYTRPDQDEAYGRGLKADLEYVQSGAWNLYLHQNIQTKEQWLRTMYYAAEPLINPDLETVAPVPTHFQVVFNHITYEFSVDDQWRDALRVNNDLKDGELLLIRWIRREAFADLELATTGLPALQR